MRTDRISLLRASLAIIFVLAVIASGSGVMAQAKPPSGLVSEHSISIEEAQGLMAGGKAVLLDVLSDDESTSQIDGAVPVTLENLACGSCIRAKLAGCETVIVYSENSLLEGEAFDLLRGAGLNATGLTGTPTSNDFPSRFKPVRSAPQSREADLSNERHSMVHLNGTDVAVGAYSRYGRITHLYGEAFGSGFSPVDSAEAFVAANAGVFGVDPEDLVDIHLQPIMYDHDAERYKFMGVNYSQYEAGIPVFRGRLVLLVRNEPGYPLVLASADLRNLGGFVPRLDPENLNPGLGIEKAAEAAPGLVNFTDPQMVIWAGINDISARPTLAYSFIGDNGYESGSTNPAKRLFVTDAATGEILYSEDMILHTDVYGKVEGKATQNYAAEQCDEELATPMPYAEVAIGSTVAYADENGDFVIPNAGDSQVTVESWMRGQWFKVQNQGSGGNAHLSLNVIPPGPANFLHNEPNSDENLRAQVNGYLQANVVHDLVLYVNPDYPNMHQFQFPVNVNLNSTCNAYYDYSSINFYHSGGGCPNTAFGTVVHHEYGHHVVSCGGSGQDQYGEGMADVMGVLITDDSGLAYGFYMDCDVPLRNADNDMQYPCSGESHYCGPLLSGCVWSTRNELVVTEPDDYHDILANLAINAVLLHTGSVIDPSITIDWLTLDDDNGDIYDGTPHYYEIAAGFGAHNMDAPELAFISFAFPNGLPDLISPSGGTRVRVEVDAVIEDPEPGTGILHFDDGSGWVEIPMEEIQDNLYDAVFPAVECGTKVSYYFSAESTEGHIQYYPAGAPNDVLTAVAAYGMEIVFADNFEADLGWTVQNDQYLTSGAWQRGVPAGNGDRGDPPTDYDGSGKCYVTGNAYGDYDVDGGTTWLISPTMDLSEGGTSEISFALWYTNNYGNDPNNDLFKIYVSNNNGSTWVLAETVGPQTPEPEEWYVHSFIVNDFVTPTNQVKVRFEASDLNDGSVVEAGIDAVGVKTYICAQVSLPEDYTVVRGIPAYGGLADLFASDDSRLGTNAGPTLDPAEPPVWLVIDGTASVATPSEFAFTLEAKANTSGLRQKIELYNYITESFEEVDSRAATTTDSVVEVTVTGDPSRFIDPGNLAMKAQLTWKPSGPVLIWPFTVGIDQAVWKMLP
jgi:hypothetical protein